MQGQPTTEFLDSFLTADNVIREERNDSSEEGMKEEHGSVSASTLLDFFNQLQVTFSLTFLKHYFKHF